MKFNIKLSVKISSCPKTIISNALTAPPKKVSDLAMNGRSQDLI